MWIVDSIEAWAVWSEETGERVTELFESEDDALDALKELEAELDYREAVRNERW